MRLPEREEYLIGVISDTHGVLRPEAVQALQGADFIVHAGDIGDPRVLTALESIAPVAAVRGNVDVEPWARPLPETAVVEVGAVSLYLLHDLGTLDLDPLAAGFQAVVFGHSHQPAVSRRNGILYLNPGSAGPRRFRLPISLARLRVRGTTLLPELVEMKV